MTCTAIITEDGIDQIIEHEGNFAAIIRREVRDLRAMDIGKVSTRVFENETLAYEWADTQTRF